MANPLRSEADAYRFLMVTIGYFAAIVGERRIEDDRSAEREIEGLHLIRVLVEEKSEIRCVWSLPGNLEKHNVETLCLA